MKAYLIDPFTKTVSEVDYDGNYQNIYKLISSDTNPVSTFTCVNVNEAEDTVFVDDEGLLDNMNTQQFFSLNGYPLAGKGLVLGTNEDGESVTPSISLKEFLMDNDISFPTQEYIKKNARSF